MSALLVLPEVCACGRPACFGFGVSLLRGRVGRWSCDSVDCCIRAERGDRAAAPSPDAASDLPAVVDPNDVLAAGAAAPASQAAVETAQPQVLGQGTPGRQGRPVDRAGAAAGEAVADDGGADRRDVAHPHVPLEQHRTPSVPDLFSMPAVAGGRDGGAGQGWGDRG